MLFTRQDYAFWDQIAEGTITGDWSIFEFPESVTKLRIFNASLWFAFAEMEVKIEGVDGSFLLTPVNELDLDNHVVDKVECRLHAYGTASTPNVYASVIGFAKREGEE